MLAREHGEFKHLDASRAQHNTAPVGTSIDAVATQQNFAPGQSNTRIAFPVHHSRHCSAIASRAARLSGMAGVARHDALVCGALAAALRPRIEIRKRREVHLRAAYPLAEPVDVRIGEREVAEQELLTGERAVEDAEQLREI